MKNIIVVTVVASVATGAFAGWGDLGKAAAGVGAKTAINAAAAAQEQKQRERRAKEENRQRKVKEEECQRVAAERKKKVDEEKAASEKAAAEKAAAEAEQAAKAVKEKEEIDAKYGKFEDRLASFCGFKFGEKGKSGTVNLAKPFRMFKTAELTCEDDRIKEVTLSLKLTTAMGSDARKKEVEAVKNIMENKYKIKFEFQDGTMWDSFLQAYTYNDHGTRLELYFNNMKDHMSITAINVPAWRKACAPAELPADAGSDAL